METSVGCVNNAVESDAVSDAVESDALSGARTMNQPFFRRRPRDPCRRLFAAFHGLCRMQRGLARSGILSLNVLGRVESGLSGAEPEEENKGAHQEHRPPIFMRVTTDETAGKAVGLNVRWRVSEWRQLGDRAAVGCRRESGQ